MSLRLSPMLIALPVVLTLFAACGDRTPDADSNSARTEYPREVLQAHMKDHFYKATEIQAAVINGDLEAVREPATWMAEHANSAAMPKEWAQHAQAMHEAALHAAQATSLTDAARAAAQMGAECGSCHRALGAEVTFTVEEPPPEGAGAVAHMDRHAWASGRMWEGMIAPSDVLWDEGAEVLSEAPLAPAELPVDLDVLADVSEMEASIHSMGAGAVGLTGQKERAGVYGRFLGTCASCHEKTGRGKI